MTREQHFLCFIICCISASQEDEEEGRGEDRANDETVRKEQEPPVDQTLYYEEKVAPILDEINRALTCGQSSLSFVCSALSYFSVLCFTLYYQDTHFLFSLHDRVSFLLSQHFFFLPYIITPYHLLYNALLILPYTLQLYPILYCTHKYILHSSLLFVSDLHPFCSSCIASYM